MVSRPMFALVGILGILAATAVANATSEDDAEEGTNGTCQGRGCRGTTPDGYNGFLVFMATGALPATDSYFLDGTNFQENILGRTAAEISEDRQNALDYFSTRFGINNADSNSDVAFISFYADPRIDYRAYVISGKRVPREGFQVHDGGWIALVTNPNGMTLGGQYAGMHVPLYSVFSFGDYSIQRTKPGNGPQPPPIVIHYQCNDPLVPLFNGGEVFQCDLYSDEFGVGRGQGMTAPVYEDGMLKPNGRTVLTFSDSGGF